MYPLGLKAMQREKRMISKRKGCVHGWQKYFFLMDRSMYFVFLLTFCDFLNHIFFYQIDLFHEKSDKEHSKRVIYDRTYYI